MSDYKSKQEDRLTVYEPVTETDKYGSERTVWTARGTYWAERVKRVGSLTGEVGERFNTVSTEWLVNYALLSKFPVHWRVKDLRNDGMLYAIHDTTPRRDIGRAVISCERVNE